MTLRETIHQAIKKHGGLSDWDDDGIAGEVDTIIKALRNHGYVSWEEMDDSYATASDLDVVGSCIGMRKIDGGSPNGLIEIFVEDDETYHRKLTINKFWLDDLIVVATQMNNV